MDELKFLLLCNVQLSGCYKKFPKKLRWLCWRYLRLESIPSDFPLENLVAIDLCYSSLKHLWEGHKLLRCLKFLNLSHSYHLSRTPDFSELPNLEKLILEYCVSLTEVDDTIGYLEGLTVLNLSGCRNLRRIPECICMLKHLETLDISGCSNLEYAAVKLEKSDSWHTTLWSLVRKEKVCHRVSPISFPTSLVILSLSDCNLGDDAFLRVDFSKLNLLKDLNLSRNPICHPPESIRYLSRLENLSLNSCTRLKSITELPNGVENVDATDCISLEKVSGAPSECSVLYLNCANLVEMNAVFKLEPLENVDAEILSYLGLSNMELIRNVSYRLRLDMERLHPDETEFPQFVQNDIAKLKHLPPKELPAQGYFCNGVFSTFLLGEHVPIFFNMKLSEPFHSSFIVPTTPDNPRIRGLSFCLVYSCSESTEVVTEGLCLSIKINNLSRQIQWKQNPVLLAIPEGEELIMWLSYWAIGDSLRSGEAVEVSASVGDEQRFSIKEVGMRILFLEEQHERSKESECEVEEFVSPCHQNLLFVRVFPV